HRGRRHHLHRCHRRPVRRGRPGHDQLDRQPDHARGRRPLPGHRGEDDRVRRVRLAAAGQGRPAAHLADPQAARRPAHREPRRRGQHRREDPGRDPRGRRARQALPGPGRGRRGRGRQGGQGLRFRGGRGGEEARRRGRRGRRGRSGPAPAPPQPRRAQQREHLILARPHRGGRILRGAAAPRLCTGPRTGLAPGAPRPVERDTGADAAPPEGARTGPTQTIVRRMELSSPATAAEQDPGTTVTLLEPGEGSGLVRRTVLPGGLRVVTEEVPGLRSAAFGISATTGSRDEDDAHAGAAHFLEHLLFKGTATRGAMEISAALDAVGADHNAYTTKEQTSYYAKVLDRDLPLAVDVVGDMVAHSVLDPGEVETERGVILEEIAMYEDEPADLVDDVFAAHVFAGSALGRPILGTNETIGRISRDRIAEQYRAAYRPAELIVAAAGNLDHEQVVRGVRESFADVLAEAGDERPAAPRIGGAAVRVHPGTALLSRETEQAHLILGCEGVRRTDPRWY